MCGAETGGGMGEPAWMGVGEGGVLARYVRRWAVMVASSSSSHPPCSPPFNARTHTQTHRLRTVHTHTRAMLRTLTVANRIKFTVLSNTVHRHLPLEECILGGAGGAAKTCSLLADSAHLPPFAPFPFSPCNLHGSAALSLATAPGIGCVSHSVLMVTSLHEFHTCDR
jgi:hypothetical protein